MKIQSYIRRFGIGILAALWLVGCSGGAAKTAETAVQERSAVESTEAESAGKADEAGQSTSADSGQTEERKSGEANAAGETSGEVSDVDRYEEIMDRSGDDGKLVMYFLDLEVSPAATDKSGDSTILISPDGKVMLLDAGHPECGPQVLEVLNALGIEKIDYLVASHPHIDHIGGIPEVIANIPIEAAYASYVEYTTQTYQDYLDAIETCGAELQRLKTGDVIDFGDQVKIEILGPGENIEYPEDFPNNSTQFLNNNSLLMKFVFGESTALFGGDLYIAQERDYIEQYGDALHVDVAKADHHGKDTSNLKKWIKTVSPQVVVAMGDEMGSMDAYNNYVKQGASYHHTLYDGIVKVIVDDKKNCEVIDQKDSWMN